MLNYANDCYVPSKKRVLVKHCTGPKHICYTLRAELWQFGRSASRQEIEEELRIALTTGVMPEDEKAFPSSMAVWIWKNGQDLNMVV